MEKTSSALSLDFCVRQLLIHDYRRVVPRDPHLLADLLSADWPGHATRQRCAAPYLLMLPMSELWLDRHANGELGGILAADISLHRRFVTA